FPAPTCLYRQEGQRIDLILPEQEGATPMALGEGEDLVDGRHQPFGGAEVGLQVVVAAFGGGPRLEVGEDVRATEGVDGLLGVADQQDGAVVALLPADAVDALEDAVLQRVGVLE